MFAFGEGVQVSLYKKQKENRETTRSDFSVLSMGCKKDIFAVFAYEFELSHLLVKSFAFAHGEIQNKFWMKYFAFRQNVKLNPPTRRRGEFHTP